MSGYLAMCCTVRFIQKHVRHDVPVEVQHKKANQVAVKRRQVYEPGGEDNINTTLFIPEHLAFNIVRQLKRQQEEIARKYPNRKNRRGLPVTIDLAKTPISYRLVVGEGRKSRGGVLTTLKVAVVEEKLGTGQHEGAQGSVDEMQYKINHLDPRQF